MSTDRRQEASGARARRTHPPAVTLYPWGRDPGPRRALIVTDDQHDQVLVERLTGMIRTEGWDAFVATSAAEALHIAGLKPSPQVVCISRRLPLPLHAFELARVIRANAPAPVWLVSWGSSSQRPVPHDPFDAWLVVPASRDDIAAVLRGAPLA